jgi:type I restriction enzyme S subunit
VSEASLPPGWARVEIKDLISPDGVFVDGDWVESKDQDPDGDVRLIQLADVGEGAFLNKSARFLTSAKAAELRCTFLKKGDVLVARMPDPLGRACIFPLEGDDRFVTVVDVCIIRTSLNIASPEFLTSAINYLGTRKQIEALQTGTTRKRVSRGNLATVTIPLPPLAEQKRIVAKIEELFSELEAGEESLRVARRQLGVYRQSLLKQAFEGHLTAKWRTQNPESVSAAWREVEVSDVLTSKPTNGRSVKDRAGGFRVLRLTAIKGGVIDPSESKEGDWDAADAAAHVIRKGNFLLSRGNGSIRLVGRGGIVRENADIAFPDTMIRLPLNLQLVDPLFFSYLWNSQQVRAQIEASARTTAGIYKINQSLLTRYRIPLCSLPEQQEIVRLLDEQFEVIERNERELDGALRQSEALRQAILQKAFTGRLVPQDPADEPASALLARLRAAPPGNPVPRVTKSATLPAII